jgi:hypothetical protein
MKLQDLQYLPPTSLATSQTVFRVQRRRARPGTARVGPLKLPPADSLTSRFALGTALVGYFYESLVRREAASLSLATAASRELLCLQATRPVNLLDLRPHAPTWPFLQSLRFEATRAVALEAMAAGFEGIAYRSAQHYGQDCFALFGPALEALALVRRERLMLADGSMHQALYAAIRGGQIAVTR